MKRPPNDAEIADAASLCAQAVKMNGLHAQMEYEAALVVAQLKNHGITIDFDLKFFNRKIPTPLGPPLTPIDAVVTVGGTTTQRTRSVCVLPHSITPSGASIEDVEVTPDV